MSTSIATSPRSGPRTPSRGQAPPVQLAKSSPVGKVYNYYLPENCEQYQKFGYDEAFLLGAFDRKSTFLRFLNVVLPKSFPKIHPTGKKSFITSANKVARFIKDQHFPERDILEFHDTSSIIPLGHVTDTQCRPDITAAFQGHWDNKGVVPWPFIRLAGESASAKKSKDDQKGQAISYLHYLLLARPDLYVAQGLLSSDDRVTFLFGIGGEGIREFDVKWKNRDLNKLLYAFIYRLYEPGDSFADPSYIETEFDKDTEGKYTTAKYTIDIQYRGGRTASGFYSIYARNPFATRTHVLSNPNFKVEDNDLTVLKDQFCRVKRRFEELKILNEHVHKPERVPGVVVAAYGEQIKPPLSKERFKYRLGLEDSGSPFMSIPTLSKVLETLFDVLEVLRYLRQHRNVLHRDISSGNVLYVENSSNRLLPPNTLSVPPTQEAETNGLPLCYAKYLLGKSNNSLETSMLLVDFNLAEHLEPKTSVKEKQIHRMGTPLFIARAVERGGPVPPVLTAIPGIPNSPDLYAKAHPDRVEKFPSSKDKFTFNPHDLDPDELDKNGSHDGWRHELEHDAESIFWLLFYWAMVVQPEEYLKESIDAASWSLLNGNHESRQVLIAIRALPGMSSNYIHSFYKPLQPLIQDLAAVLVVDSHWLPASDPRKDPFYITEAFQRLILEFIIANQKEDFMHHRVEKTIRKVHGMQDSNALSTSNIQSLDAAAREGVIRGTDVVEMNVVEMDDDEVDDDEMDDNQ